MLSLFVPGIDIPTIYNYVGYWRFKMEGVSSLHYNLLLYCVPPTRGVWGTKIWSRLHVNLCFKIILLIRVWLLSVLPLASNRDLQQTNLYYDAHGMTNLSLGVIQKTSYPKFMKPIQLQNNIGLTWKKLFIAKNLSNGYPSQVEFKTLIKFTKKCVLMWKMNA